MKRVWSRKKNNRLSRLVTLTLCVVCLFGTNGVPLTAFAETGTSGFTEDNATVEETSVTSESKVDSADETNTSSDENSDDNDTSEKNNETENETESGSNSIVSETSKHIDGCSDSCKVEDCLCSCHSDAADNESDEKVDTEEKFYTVSFSVGTEAEEANVSAPEKISVKEKEAVGSLPSPVWNDTDGNTVKTFGGWYTDTEFNTAFYASTSVVSDITVYAKWNSLDEEDIYYVNFYGLDETNIQTLSVTGGKTVEPAGGPVLNEKVFCGWSTQKQADSSATVIKKFDFNVPVSEAVEKGKNTLDLYAWYDDASSEVSYTVSFDVGKEAVDAGVSVPKAVTVKEGGTINSLPVPVWSGEDGKPVMAFGGWYADKELNSEFNTGSAVKVDVTLYAKWNKLDDETLYYVNFYSQDGADICTTLSASKGQTVSPADAPELEKKSFYGWSTVMQENTPAADIDAFDFNVFVCDAVEKGKNTLNLYAWYDAVEEEKPYVVTFDIGEEAAKAGVVVPEDIEVNVKGTVDKLPVPVWKSKDGKIVKDFIGWYVDEELSEEFDTSTIVKADMTVYAMWGRPMLKAPSARDDLRPDTNFIRVQKTFVGIEEGQIPENFKIVVTSASGTNYVLEKNGAQVSADGLTWNWEIQNVDVGEYRVQESGQNIDGYGVECSGIGNVTVEAAQLSNLKTVIETTCSHTDWEVDVDGTSNVMFAAALTGGESCIVISKLPLSSTERAAVEAELRNATGGNWKMPPNFFSIETNGNGPYTVAGKKLWYVPSEGKVYLDNPSNWSQVASVSYDVSGAVNPDIQITNTYTKQTTDVRIKKMVAGSMGDITKTFNFEVTCSKPIGEPVKEEYTLSNDKKTATFSLTHEQEIILNGVEKGAILTVKELNAEGYEIGVIVGTQTLESNPDGLYTVLVNTVDGISIVVTNTKEGVPDTGVILDSLPYILILAIVAIGGVFVIIKKRRMRDDD